MELRQLQYFLAVAESGSFSRASSVIGVAQPALSRHIRQLEEELGVDLFYRHGRGVQLTDEGQTFRARIAPLVREMAMAAADLSTGSAVPAGAIVLGMTPALCGVIAPPLVKLFLEQFPQVRLNIVEGYSGYINEWLMSNRLDMAVINNARRSPHITMEPMLAVDLFYVAARDGDAAVEDTISFDAVLDTALILPGRHHGLRRELEAAARRHGRPLNVAIEMDALSACLELVRSGVGPTVLPPGATREILNDAGVVVRRVVDPEINMQFRIAYSLERPTTVLMRHLSRAIRAEVGRAVADGRMSGKLIGPASPV